MRALNATRINKSPPFSSGFSTRSRRSRASSPFPNTPRPEAGTNTNTARAYPYLLRCDKSCLPAMSCMRAVHACRGELSCSAACLCCMVCRQVRPGCEGVWWRWRQARAHPRTPPPFLSHTRAFSMHSCLLPAAACAGCGDDCDPNLYACGAPVATVCLTPSPRLTASFYRLRHRVCPAHGRTHTSL